MNGDGKRMRAKGSQVLIDRCTNDLETPASWYAGRAAHNVLGNYGFLTCGMGRARAEGAWKLSLLEWGKQYLPAHFLQPSSAMHRWLSDQLSEFKRTRGLKLNLIGPRGAAKSTVATLCYVLRSAVEEMEPYIWIVSDTKHQAQAHLENVRVELSENRLLAAHYPQAAGRGSRWQATSLRLRNGVVIESFGTNQRIRGYRRQANRPTFIVCDDLQNDGHIASALQRQKSREWFYGSLLNAGTWRTNVINLATALHRDALAMELHETPGWNSELFRAIVTWPERMDLWHEWERIYTNVSDSDAVTNARKYYEQYRDVMDAGAALLWPEVEDLYTLMQMRVDSGHTAFEREKQGSPIDPEVCEWPEDYFGDHIWFDAWPEGLATKTMALDPSKGSDARRGDYSALVMLGIDATGVMYVEADLARRTTTEIVTRGVEWCRQFRPLSFGIETNQYQDLLAGEFARELKRWQLRLEPYGIHNTLNKQVRIRRLGPLLSQRRLRFLASSPSTRLLVNQLRDFPAGAHDDGPDALEMAVRLAEETCSAGPFDDGLGNRLVVG